MSSYYKPRTFRSSQGCCVCRCKSSSSRFTDSSKYEPDFSSCFLLSDRSGEICNACVLLVKRSRNLPPGSTKNWSHVVDSRAGPGGSRSLLSRQRSRQPPLLHGDPDVKTHKIGRQLSRLSKQKTSRKSCPTIQSKETAETDKLADRGVVSTGQDRDSEPFRDGIVSGDKIDSCIDQTYWTRTKVCCGEVYIGMCQELLIDTKHYRPCYLRKKTSRDGSVSSRSRTDTFSSNESCHQPHTNSPTLLTPAQLHHTTPIHLNPSQ